MPPSYVHIISKLNGLVIEIRGSSSSPGTDVIMGTEKTPASDNQLWFPDATAGVIRSKLKPEFCLQKSGRYTKLEDEAVSSTCLNCMLIGT